MPILTSARAIPMVRRNLPPCCTMAPKACSTRARWRDRRVSASSPGPWSKGGCAAPSHGFGCGNFFDRAFAPLPLNDRRCPQKPVRPDSPGPEALPGTDRHAQRPEPVEYAVPVIHDGVGDLDDGRDTLNQPLTVLITPS